MRNRFVKSAVWNAMITLFGRLLGFIRTVFVSQEFGTTLQASAFLLAFKIPNLFFMFLPGALNAAFIPKLKGYVLQNNPQRARELYQKILTLSAFAFLMAGGFLFLASDWIITLIAGEASLELQQLSSDLLRWMLPSILFIVFIGVFSSTLNVHYYFVLPNFGTIINSLIVIAAIFVLVPRMGIHGLALGTTLGFAGAALIMLPAIFKEKYPFRLNWRWNDPDLVEIGKRLFPLLLASVLTAFFEFTEVYFVADYGDDKISALNYARQTFQLPVAVLYGAITVPLFVAMLDAFKLNQAEAAKQTLEKGLRYMLIVLLPASAGISVLGEEIIAALFQRGEFTIESTQMTAKAFTLFSWGLFPFAMRDLFTRAFYALENTWTPLLVTGLQFLAYLLVSPLLLHWLGFSGAALSYTLTTLLNGLILGYLLHRRIGKLLSNQFWMTFLKVSLATLAMSLALVCILPLLSSWNLYLRVSLEIMAGALVYGAVILLAKEPLIHEIFRLRRKR